MRDLFELSLDEEASSIEVLSRLIRQYPNAFQNAEHAARDMGLLLLRAIITAWCNKKFDGLKTVDDIRFPRHIKMLANACFYVVSQNYPEHSAEYRIALFIHIITKRIVDTTVMPTLSQKLVNIICGLASGFLQGHFMNIDGVNKHLAALQKLPKETMAAVTLQ
jgi:hypothetical protein